VVKTTRVSITPQGPFSLERLALFGFGHRHQQAFDGTMRMAFVADNLESSAAVAITQRRNGDLDCEVHHEGDTVDEVDKANQADEADVGSLCTQIKRVLSLDYDGDAFVAMCKQDPILSKLVMRAPGLRPPLFHSPYEAAAWSIVSARRSAAQMSKVWTAISQQHGSTFAVAGQLISAFPTPAKLASIPSFPGLDATKIDRLHGVADAAREGHLSVARIQKLGPEVASKELRTIKGIGPFYASLIVVRASGFADIAPTEEPNALQLAGQLYGPSLFGSTNAFTPEQFAKLAEGWRPFRTWAAVLLRSTGPQFVKP
jgi:DNA-3-methyladenine glycosylase II